MIIIITTVWYIYIVLYDIRIMLGVLTLLGLYQDVFVLIQGRNYCILWFI